MGILEYQLHFDRMGLQSLPAGVSCEATFAPGFDQTVASVPREAPAAECRFGFASAREAHLQGSLARAGLSPCSGAPRAAGSSSRPS